MNSKYCSINLEVTAELSHLAHHLLRNALIEETVEDRVGTGGGHPHQMEDGEPNHDGIIIEKIKHFSQDTEHTEGKPAGKFCLLINFPVQQHKLT